MPIKNFFMAALMVQCTYYISAVLEMVCKLLEKASMKYLNKYCRRNGKYSKIYNALSSSK
jgi:hypothetical protein